MKNEPMDIGVKSEGTPKERCFIPVVQNCQKRPSNMQDLPINTLSQLNEQDLFSSQTEMNTSKKRKAEPSVLNHKKCKYFHADHQILPAENTTNLANSSQSAGVGPENDANDIITPGPERAQIINMLASFVSQLETSYNSSSTPHSNSNNHVQNSTNVPAIENLPKFQPMSAAYKTSILANSSGTVDIGPDLTYNNNPKPLGNTLISDISASFYPPLPFVPPPSSTYKANNYGQNGIPALENQRKSYPISTARRTTNLANLANAPKSVDIRPDLNNILEPPKSPKSAKIWNIPTAVDPPLPFTPSTSSKSQVNNLVIPTVVRNQISTLYNNTNFPNSAENVDIAPDLGCNRILGLPQNSQITKTLPSFDPELPPLKSSIPAVGNQPKSYQMSQIRTTNNVVNSSESADIGPDLECNRILGLPQNSQITKTLPSFDPELPSKPSPLKSSIPAMGKQPKSYQMSQIRTTNNVVNSSESVDISPGLECNSILGLPKNSQITKTLPSFDPQLPPLKSSFPAVRNQPKSYQMAQIRTTNNLVDSSKSADIGPDLECNRILGLPKNSQVTKTTASFDPKSPLTTKPSKSKSNNYGQNGIPTIRKQPASSNLANSSESVNIGPDLEFNFILELSQNSPKIFTTFDPELPPIPVSKSNNYGQNGIPAIENQPKSYPIPTALRTTNLANAPKSVDIGPDLHNILEPPESCKSAKILNIAAVFVPQLPFTPSTYSKSQVNNPVIPTVRNITGSDKISAVCNTTTFPNSSEGVYIDPDFDERNSNLGLPKNSQITQTLASFDLELAVTTSSSKSTSDNYGQNIIPTTSGKQPSSFRTTNLVNSSKSVDIGPDLECIDNKILGLPKTSQITQTLANFDPKSPLTTTTSKSKPNNCDQNGISTLRKQPARSNLANASEIVDIGPDLECNSVLGLPKNSQIPKTLANFNPELPVTIIRPLSAKSKSNNYGQNVIPTVGKQPNSFQMSFIPKNNLSNSSKSVDIGPDLECTHNSILALPKTSPITQTLANFDPKSPLTTKSSNSKANNSGQNVIGKQPKSLQMSRTLATNLANLAESLDIGPDPQCNSILGLPKNTQIAKTLANFDPKSPLTTTTSKSKSKNGGQNSIGKPSNSLQQVFCTRTTNFPISSDSVDIGPDLQPPENSEISARFYPPLPLPIELSSPRTNSNYGQNNQGNSTKIHQIPPDPLIIPRLIPCRQCPEKFLNNTQLSQHGASAHSFKCTICSKNFGYARSLKEHMRAVHEKQLPYKCPFCPKSCSKMCNLKGHIATVHDNHRPYECTICNKGYIRPDYLQQHISMHHS